MKKTLLSTFSLLLILIISQYSIAQVTIGSGSLSYTRDMANGTNSGSYSRGYDAKHFNMPAASTFIVEDFFNYHEHKILIPQEKDVALSIDYSNSIFNSSDEFLLQVGIATQPAHLRAKERNAVNISLVVDVSGSMDGAKIRSVRTALNRFVRALSNGDQLSIIEFSGEAEIVLSTTKLSENRKEIYSIIDNMKANGMTNLNAGMMLGYQEIAKKHTKLTNSRVILLTDGETNQGETNHSQIIKNSTEYNKEGIEITTIGVGQSLDFDLLRQLADRGKGSNYFIGENEEDIKKVFEDELQGLLYKIGSEQVLSLTLPTGWEIMNVYGYETRYTKDAHSIQFKFDNLSASSTRLALLRIKKNSSKLKNEIDAKLSYSKGGEHVSVNAKKKYNAEETYTNKEIRKNYDIAFMAQNMKEAAIAIGNNDSTRAKLILNEAKAHVQDSPFLDDSDFVRVYEILNAYAPKNNKCTDKLIKE